MSTKSKGWLIVAIQFLFVGLIIFLPNGTNWNSTGIVRLIANLIILSGVAIVCIAAFKLGSNLTPTPEPIEQGKLITTGIYKYVRHPIYFGLIVSIAGIVINSGSYLILGIAVAFYIFLHYKADWEEKRLTETYPGYEDYTKHTARIIPKLF